jgi:Fe2+ or Zn2+ uptake regulation protein
MLPMKTSTLDTQRQVTRLREAGLKATASRTAILAFLEADHSHPTAEMVYERLAGTLPTLSLSTVYATLESFLAAGLVRRIHTDGGKLRVDGTGGDHDHAVCRRCGDVFDVARASGDRSHARRDLPGGFEVLDVHVQYDVVCPSCGGDDQA